MTRSSCPRLALAVAALAVVAGCSKSSTLTAKATFTETHMIVEGVPPSEDGLVVKLGPNASNLDKVLTTDSPDSFRFEVPLARLKPGPLTFEVRVFDVAMGGPPKMTTKVTTTVPDHAFVDIFSVPLKRAMLQLDVEGAPGGRLPVGMTNGFEIGLDLRGPPGLKASIGKASVTLKESGRGILAINVADWVGAVPTSAFAGELGAAIPRKAAPLPKHPLELKLVNGKVQRSVKLTLSTSALSVAVMHRLITAWAGAMAYGKTPKPAPGGPVLLFGSRTAFDGSDIAVGKNRTRAVIAGTHGPLASVGKIVLVNTKKADPVDCGTYVNRQTKERISGVLRASDVTLKAHVHGVDKATITTLPHLGKKGCPDTSKAWKGAKNIAELDIRPSPEALKSFIATVKAK